MRLEPGSLQPTWRASGDLGRPGIASAAAPVAGDQAPPVVPRRPSLRQNFIRWRRGAGSIGGLKHYVPSRTRSFRQDPYRLQPRRPRADKSTSLTMPPMVRHPVGTSAEPSAERPRLPRYPLVKLIESRRPAPPFTLLPRNSHPRPRLVTPLKALC